MLAASTAGVCAEERLSTTVCFMPATIVVVRSAAVALVVSSVNFGNFNSGKLAVGVCSSGDLSSL